VAKLAEPGRVYEIEIDMVATSVVFLAGHRIAVEISSSNFPRFDRNPNHGGVIAEATESDFVIARQCVFQDADRASYVTLPYIPSGGV
jgi:putative CocE/NonD family hydrolase